MSVEPADDVATRRRIIEAADAVRQDVASDLHDGAQQQFVLALVRLRMAQDNWSSNPDRARQLLDLGVDQAAAGIDSLRDLAAGLHPPLLAQQGLGDAVRALAAALPLPVVVDAMPGRLGPGAEASLYFFVSEALTNVLKHADASQAGVWIHAEGEKVVVGVGDDGAGGVTRAEWGAGLHGLDDRIAALGGTFAVTSPPGDGTTLQAELPRAGLL